MEGRNEGKRNRAGKKTERKRKRKGRQLEEKEKNRETRKVRGRKEGRKE